MPLELKLDISWRMGVGRTEPVPELLFLLLEQIDNHGSISAAARHCDISYRSAWNMISLWRERLGAPLVISRQGRGASLEPLGRKMMWAFQYAREQSEVPLHHIEERVKREMQSIIRTQSADLIRIHASHCPSHANLRTLMEQEYGMECRIDHGGSVRALIHLVAGDCHAAGFHLAEGVLAKGFMQQYRTYLESAECRVIHAIRRRQGLIVPRGNPRKVTGLEDLMRDDVRIVNRQVNSGTRMLLDLLLDTMGMDKNRIRGYDNIEFTHSAVSALVAGDQVDVGIGTEAAAVAFELDFIPLATEVYYYAVKRSEWRHPAVRALRALLGSESWRETMSVRDGFDVRDAGTTLDAEVLVSGSLSESHSELE